MGAPLASTHLMTGGAEDSAPRRPPSVGLQMIVKNESENIRQNFRSLKGHVDGFCICDTGSQDDTMAEIAGMSRELGVPGTILVHTWQNFAHNRNLCLVRCTELFDHDYWILLDADQELISPEISLKALLAALGPHDAFWMREEYASIPIYHLRVISSSIMDWQYTGIIHEYLHSSAENISYGVVPDLVYTIHHQQDHRDSMHDIDKMLTSLHKINPNDTRMMFHLAKAYESHNVSAAVEWYHCRINHESAHAQPSEEVFWSKYSIACLMEEALVLKTSLGQSRIAGDERWQQRKSIPFGASLSFHTVKEAYLSAAEYLTYRYEPWLRIAQLYIHHEKNYIQCLVFSVAGLRAGPHAYYTLFPDPQSLEKLHALVCVCGLKTGHMSLAIESCTKNGRGAMDRMHDGSLGRLTFYASSLMEAALRVLMSDRTTALICKPHGNDLAESDGNISGAVELARHHV